VGGGTNWWPPSFDPSRMLLFVPTVDAAGMYFSEDAVYQRGEPYLGGSSRNAESLPVKIAFKAIDPSSGAIRWERVVAEGGAGLHESVGGMLSTSAGVVFGGYRDELFALDADTGRVLRRVRVGGIINAAPVSYRAGGRQFVALMAGHALFAFALP
jgi:alcohol dehydrogenase (cytochrome c)